MVTLRPVFFHFFVVGFVVPLLRKLTPAAWSLLAPKTALVTALKTSNLTAYAECVAQQNVDYLGCGSTWHVGLVRAGSGCPYCSLSRSHWTDGEQHLLVAFFHPQSATLPLVRFAPRERHVNSSQFPQPFMALYNNVYSRMMPYHGHVECRSAAASTARST